MPLPTSAFKGGGNINGGSVWMSEDEALKVDLFSRFFDHSDTRRHPLQTTVKR